jgi:hypothetical protein
MDPNQIWFVSIIVFLEQTQSAKPSYDGNVISSLNDVGTTYNLQHHNNYYK